MFAQPAPSCEVFGIMELPAIGTKVRCKISPQLGCPQGCPGGKTAVVTEVFMAGYGQTVILSCGGHDIVMYAIDYPLFFEPLTSIQE